MNKSVEAELRMEDIKENDFDRVWKAIETLMRDCQDKGIAPEDSNLKMHVELNDKFPPIFSMRIEDMKKSFEKSIDMLAGICQSPEFKDFTAEKREQYRSSLLKICIACQELNEQG
jgi:hypothetical protein